MASFVGAISGTNTATIPAHIAGDLIIARAFRDGNNNAPTIPSGQNWSTIDNTAGANQNGAAFVYKIAAGSSEATGTFTNATRLEVGVWRGFSGIGLSNVDGAASTTVNYPNLGTLASANNWVAAFGAHRSTNTALENPPGAMSNRHTSVNGTDEGAIHDTNGGVASWSGTTVSVGGTSSGWRAHTVEMIVLSNVTGTISQTLPKLAQSAAGTVDNARTGTAANILPKLSQDAAGAQTNDGTAAQTLPKLAQEAAGTVEVLAISGEIAQALPALTQAASGTVDNARTGTAAQSLPSLTQAAAGTVEEGQSVGTVLDLDPYGGAVHIPKRKKRKKPTSFTRAIIKAVRPEAETPRFEPIIDSALIALVEQAADEQQIRLNAEMRERAIADFRARERAAIKAAQEARDREDEETVLQALLLGIL